MGFLKYVRAQWDRTAAVASTVIGLVCLLLGWLGTSGTEHLAKQMPYIVSGGMAGIFFLGVGAAMWISADLRDEWRELRSIGAQLREEQLERRLASEAVRAGFERPLASHARPGRD